MADNGRNGAQAPSIPGGGKLPGRVVCIGRSDCLGRAGVQGDVRAVSHFGAQSATVITMVSAEDGFNAFDWVEMPPTIIVRQMERVLRDMGADCIKLGQLHSQEIIDIVANTLERSTKDVPMVIAPVMVATDGMPYHSVRAAAALKRRLFVFASVLAVSAREASVLTGMEVRDPDQMMSAAAMLLTLGCRAVYVHGGTFGRSHSTDILITEDDIVTFDDGPALAEEVYGAKTAISGAIAACIANGDPVPAAVDRARTYLRDSFALLSLRGQQQTRRYPTGPLALDGEELVQGPKA